MMVMYGFRCPQHGSFESLLPMGAAPSRAACPRCGADAPRQVSAPRIVRSSRSAWFGAVERAEKSRHEPEFVSAVPSAGSRLRFRQAPMTPALRRLPRP
jgi:putative FmdB family regulatory protein